ncbi:unnamed protein product [Phyllotreta striolata]|uniref:BHLH domain-containing protein n=1 Tax=Phyllotreta striolata TaxID=444603 RepID=A0A9N9TP97_PHYSR|nr:unnamed protein product [Phyllotreta striolata]
MNQSYRWGAGYLFFIFRKSTTIRNRKVLETSSNSKISGIMENQAANDDRKQRKPLMEKKRRARINESLENLKTILMECDPESVSKRNAKLEKADILEMTVSYLQTMRTKRTNSYYPSSSSCSYSSQKYNQNYVTVSSKYGSGGQCCYGGSSYSYKGSGQKGSCGDKSSIWRPW